MNGYLTAPEPVRDGITRVVKYRIKPSARLTRYVRDMQEEYALLHNAGTEAVQAFRCYRAERILYDMVCNPRGHDVELYHDSVTGGTNHVYAGTPKAKNHPGIKSTTTIPMAFAHGAIRDGVTRVAARGSYMAYEPEGRNRRRPYKMISLRSMRPLGAKSHDDMVYLPGYSEPFMLREPLKADAGRMVGYVLADVTEPWESPPDSERKIELHAIYKRDVTPHMGTGVVAGIDPGGRYTAAVSYLRDGREIASQLVQMDFRAERQRLRKLHQARSRCKRGSRKYGELTEQIQKIHKKIHRKWLHEAHQQSNHIIHHSDMVRIEGGNFQTMTATGGNRKRGMNRTVKYAKPGEFRDMVLGKAQEAGKTCQEIRPKNTSKRCFPCHSYETDRNGTRLTCTSCGHQAHADLNAGSNIGSGDYDTIQWSKRAKNAAKFEAALQRSREDAYSMGAVPAPDGPTPEGAPPDSSGAPRHPALNACQPEAPPGPPACAVGSSTPLKDESRKPPNIRETASDSVSTLGVSQCATRACVERATCHTQNVARGSAPHAVAVSGRGVVQGKVRIQLRMCALPWLRLVGEA